MRAAAAADHNNIIQLEPRPILFIIIIIIFIVVAVFVVVVIVAVAANEINARTLQAYNIPSGFKYFLLY